ncbi:uncharacterized protein LOC133527166 [Cydia pomonella]|uniref:uncharacterized protein LOC133527166 n=1 Tax=Cydia pomonella TaxID=82600 RepID=UPI002ADD859B|nr:uncharacterized protein LOC133527166 [Cydia pomonella]
MSETELKDLLKKRSVIKGKVTVFKNKYVEFESKTDITSSQVNELALRLGRFEIVFNNFDDLREKIESITSDSEQLKENIQIENDFFDLINCAQEFIDMHKQRFTDADDGSVSSRNSNQQINIKLPQIKLPSFDGNYGKWLEFRDTFTSIVHNNSSLNEINKFYYLRTSLEGSAALVIKSLEISAANYAVAWSLLCDRYDNKRQLVHNHLQSLFRIEALTRESDKCLRNLIDNVTKNLRALESLGEKVDCWDTLIVFLCSSKLDPITLRKWEEKRNSLEDSPKLSEFTDFLRSRADILESLARSGSNFERPEKQPQKKLDKSQKTFVAAASHPTTTSSPQSSCLICKGHFLIGRALTSLPAPNLEEAKPSQLHRYARMEQVRQHFWARWSQEYVSLLQQRTKWRSRQPNLQPGQLVLVKQPHGPPLTWPLGRIEKLHKGSDGLCRVVDVRTRKGLVRRGISCICPLLTDGEDTDEQHC